MSTIDGTERKTASANAWAVARRYSNVLALETLDLAKHVDAALEAQQENLLTGPIGDVVRAAIAVRAHRQNMLDTKADFETLVAESNRVWGQLDAALDALPEDIVKALEAGDA